MKPKKEILRGPRFDSIDHLQPNTFVEDAQCYDEWSLNGKLVYGCVKLLRSDGRSWCSLDEIFRGNFIFCKSEESEEEKQAKKAAQLHESAKQG